MIRFQFKYKGEIILLLASFLWGTCFAFQKIGMDYIGPYTLGAFRFLIGALILIPVMFVFSREGKHDNQYIRDKNIGLFNKNLYIGGISCGIALFAAASLQQIGLQYTTAGKAGFITSLEIVLVAIIMIFINRKIKVNILFSIEFVVIGMFLLCMNSSLTLEIGDAYEFAAILFWAAQIMLIDKFVQKVDGLQLSFIQFLTTGLLSVIFMALFENPDWSEIHEGAIAILYTGIIEVAVAYTLQMIGQKYTRADVASIILSLESVFAVISGVLILGETMSMKEVLGCIFMLIAVILTQIGDKSKISEKC